MYVDKAWQAVAHDYGENVTDCKKKWRHLRSSLSRYLKSSKDLNKNKNNKLKPYYLLQHMDFLVPYTKTLDMKQEAVKFETTDDGYAEMKSENEDHSGYDHEIIQEESQSMEDEDIVYEAYEIQEQLPSNSQATPQTPKSQITLVRSTHQNSSQNTTIPQLQPIMNHSISSMSSTPKSQPLQLTSSQSGQFQQQSHQSPAGHQLKIEQPTTPVHNNGLIPIADDQSSADLNFFLALMPDVRNMTADQKRRLRIGTLKLIDDILSST